MCNLDCRFCMSNFIGFTLPDKLEMSHSHVSDRVSEMGRLTRTRELKPHPVSDDEIFFNLWNLFVIKYYVHINPKIFGLVQLYKVKKKS